MHVPDKILNKLLSARDCFGSLSGYGPGTRVRNILAAVDELAASARKDRASEPETEAKTPPCRYCNRKLTLESDSNRYRLKCNNSACPVFVKTAWFDCIDDLIASVS